MTPILDQHGLTVAYLHLNIILNTEQDRVLGLVLGNCVFGATDSPVGKFFKDTFRNMRGEIVAELANTTSSLRPAPGLRKRNIGLGMSLLLFCIIMRMLRWRFRILLLFQGL
jgi:hypothetical protein